ncbi:MAG TPA: hypothetical protein VJU83_01440 [Burkholderiales bacterium]|nr:hypothetical protein [Burkholderiales bacterium]
MRFPYLALLLLTIIYAAPAAAQNVYRCGKQYQDRPCDPVPATVHGPATATPGGGSESWEHRESRHYAEEEKKRSQWQYECSRYDQDLRNVYTTQDSGAGRSNMDTLNDRARRVEEQRKLAGCG